MALVLPPETHPQLSPSEAFAFALVTEASKQEPIRKALDGLIDAALQVCLVASTPGQEAQRILRGISDAEMRTKMLARLAEPEAAGDAALQTLLAGVFAVREKLGKCYG